MEITILKKNETRVEELSVWTLLPSRPSGKKVHVVTSGSRTGELVIYVKSVTPFDGEVYRLGNRRDVSFVPKASLCRLEEV